MKKILISEAQFNMLMKQSLLNEIKIDMNSIGTDEGEKLNAQKREKYNVGKAGHLEPNDPHIIDFKQMMQSDYMGTMHELSRIHKNYADAMNLRRPGMAAEFNKIRRYLLATGYAFKSGNSYILGNFGNGYFKVSHFSPEIGSNGKPSRSSTQAMMDIIQYDNIIFMVTDDLMVDLYKMGVYMDKDALVPAKFNGQFIAKQICTTDRNLYDFIKNDYEKQSNVGSLMDAMNRFQEYQEDHKLKLSDIKYLPKIKQYKEFGEKVKEADSDMSKIIPYIPGNKLSPEAIDIINDLISYFPDKYNPGSVDARKKIADFVANREIPKSLKDKILGYIHKVIGE